MTVTQSSRTFVDYLKSQRAHLIKLLPEECSRYESALENSGIFTHQSLAYIQSYVARGKMLRGTLVVLGYEMGGTRASPAIYQAALAMEFLQGFLLMHDDIMDNDSTRRNAPAAHTHFCQLAHTQQALQPTQYGISMAICCGDIAFALANWFMNEALAALAADYSYRQQLCSLFSLEVARVGIGQMEDVYYSQHHSEPTPEAVAQLYRNKTGRYTIALPLQVGIYLGAHIKHLDTIAEFGSQVGLIFQLRDDELSLAPLSTSGKPAGSDILNHTRTYARQLLKQRGDARQLAALAALEAKEHIDESDIATYRELLHHTGVYNHIEELIQGCATRAHDAIATLSGVDSTYTDLLDSFLNFNLSRRS